MKNQSKVRYRTFQLRVRHLGLPPRGFLLLEGPELREDLGERLELAHRVDDALLRLEEPVPDGVHLRVS